MAFRLRAKPRRAFRGGISKVNCEQSLSTFGNTCPQNGSKNEPRAPKTSLGYPHEGPSVALAQCRLPVQGAGFRTCVLFRGLGSNERRVLGSNERIVLGSNERKVWGSYERKVGGSKERCIPMTSSFVSLIILWDFTVEVDRFVKGNQRLRSK